MLRPSSIELLKKAPLFDLLPPALLNDIAVATTVIARPGGSRIFEEGSPADSCYVLTAGRAKIVIAGSNGTELTIGVVQPFSLVGEIALIDAMPRSAGFVAIDDCRLLHIPRRSFLALRQHAEFDDRLMLHVAATLRRATEQLRAIYTFDSVERVAWCLAQMAGGKGRHIGREMAIVPKPSHRELAEMTGASRETVSRALLRLRKMRWVRWDRSGFYMDTKAVGRYVGKIEAATPAGDGARTTLRAV